MKKKIIIIVISTFIVIGVSLIMFIPKITLVKNEIKLALNEEYHEEGYKATYLFKDVTKEVNIKNNIDNTKVGTYYVTYELKKPLFSIVKKRKVDVIDNIKPVITLKGNNDVVLCPNTTYTEEGYTVSDNYDKEEDLTVETIPYQDKIIYKVTDSSFNTVEVSRNLKYVDETAPVITLKGKKSMSIFEKETYTEEGYTVSDNCSQDLTEKVIVSGNVDTNKKGKYELIYSVSDESNNKTEVIREVNVISKSTATTSNIIAGPTYINGILIVNKKYSIPSTFGSKNDPQAMFNLKAMQAEAMSLGLSLDLLSGYRSYDYQKNLYNNYVKNYGQTSADTFSARPGHSEHQTGLAFDIGQISDTFGDTPSGKWLSENAHRFGFVIRYPKGKEKITGYIYEPWHVRYLGVEHATKIYNSKVTLEEYLGV